MKEELDESKRQSLATSMYKKSWDELDDRQKQTIIKLMTNLKSEEKMSAKDKLKTEILSLRHKVKLYKELYDEDVDEEKNEDELEEKKKKEAMPEDKESEEKKKEDINVDQSVQDSMPPKVDDALKGENMDDKDPMTKMTEIVEALGKRIEALEGQKELTPSQTSSEPAETGNPTIEAEVKKEEVKPEATPEQEAPMKDEADKDKEAATVSEEPKKEEEEDKKPSPPVMEKLSVKSISVKSSFKRNEGMKLFK